MSVGVTATRRTAGVEHALLHSVLKLTSCEVLSLRGEHRIVSTERSVVVGR